MAITYHTEFSSLMWLSELSAIGWSDTSASYAEAYAFALQVNGTVVFTNNYVPGPDGVTIYDLDKIIEAEMGDAIWATVVLGMNGESKTITVLRSLVDVGESASTWATDFFLTLNHKLRLTAIGRYETLTFWNTGGEAVKVKATYYSASGGVTAKTIPLAPTLPTAGVATVNVSPSRWANETLGQLIGYTVTAGDRRIDYRVLQWMPDADPAVIFRNAFGAWETMYLTGAKEQEPELTRSTATVAERFVTYDIEEVQKWKAYTGPLADGMVAVANDLARSRAVYLLNDDGTAGDEIVITDCDLKATNEDDAIPDLQFTYRRATKWPGEKQNRRPRTFDDTFDETFE